MDANERTEKLFIEAEKLGMDAPSENMVADAIACAVSQERLEIEISLEQAGFKDAARALHRWQKLAELEGAA